MSGEGERIIWYKNKMIFCYILIRKKKKIQFQLNEKR